jgi:TRAP-type mannitol/chloroaromatic compound transport system permease small subunit
MRALDKLLDTIGKVVKWLVIVLLVFGGIGKLILYVDHSLDVRAARAWEERSYEFCLHHIMSPVCAPWRHKFGKS